MSVPTQFRGAAARRAAFCFAACVVDVFLYLYFPSRQGRWALTARGNRGQRFVRLMHHCYCITYCLCCPVRQAREEPVVRDYAWESWPLWNVDPPVYTTRVITLTLSLSHSLSHSLSLSIYI